MQVEELSPQERIAKAEAIIEEAKTIIEEERDKLNDVRDNKNPLLVVVAIVCMLLFLPKRDKKDG